MRPDATSSRTEALQNSLGNVVFSRFSAGLLGKGPAVLGLRDTCLRKWYRQSSRGWDLV